MFKQLTISKWRTESILLCLNWDFWDRLDKWGRDDIHIHPRLSSGFNQSALNHTGSHYLCSMLTVSELFIYPIKSLAGIAVNSAKVTDRGFQYDRRWMLVDEDNVFFTQREFPQMALLQVEVMHDGLKVYHKIIFIHL